MTTEEEKRNKIALEMPDKIECLIKEGKEKGTIKCPFCTGIINYNGKDGMLWFAECDNCNFVIVGGRK